MERKKLRVQMIEEWQEDTAFLRKLLDPLATYQEAVTLIEKQGTTFMVGKDWTLPREGMYSHVKSIAIEFNLLKFVEVLTTLKQHFNHERTRNLLRQMGLSSSNPTGWFLQANRIPVHMVTMQSQESQYPPHHNWIYETEEIGEQWRAHLVEGKLKDKRNPRYPLHLLDPGKLQLDIPANESAIFVDSITGTLVGLVLHEFSGVMLRW